MLNHTILLARLIFNINKHAEQSDNLSGVMRDYLNTCQQCCLNIIRTCNSYKNLLPENGDMPFTNPVNFDVVDLVKGLLDAFSNNLSAYCETDINFYSRLRPFTSIRIDQKMFEITVLNILYCFVRTRTSQNSEPLRLTVYVTETYDDIILHIKSRKSDKSKNKEGGVKSVSHSIISTFLNEEEFIDLSLRLANKAASFAGGSIECKALKTTDRYDITFPKFTGSATSLGSTATYRASKELFDETCSEFNLESSLKKESMLKELIEILSSMEGWFV